MSFSSEEFCVRVLVIEDDDKIASFIVNGLKQAGFATDHSANGEDGLHLASTQHYDAAVVDSLCLLTFCSLQPCVEKTGKKPIKNSVNMRRNIM